MTAAAAPVSKMARLNGTGTIDDEEAAFGDRPRRRGIGRGRDLAAGIEDEADRRLRCRRRVRQPAVRTLLERRRVRGRQGGGRLGQEGLRLDVCCRGDHDPGKHERQDDEQAEGDPAAGQRPSSSAGRGRSASASPSAVAEGMTATTIMAPDASRATTAGERIRTVAAAARTVRGGHLWHTSPAHDADHRSHPYA